MASTSSRIRIIFDGATRGIDEAAARVRRAVRGVDEDSNNLSKAFSKIKDSFRPALLVSGFTNAIPVIAGVTAALEQLLPAAFLAPGAILTLAAAFATFKLAMSGVGDAIKSGDVSKLAPSAAATVIAIRGLSGEFDKLKKSVQGAFFNNFAGDVQRLGSVFLPVLQNRLPIIAAAFNDMGRSLTRALSQTAVIKAVDTLLDNTAFLIFQARNALGAFADGFIQLGGLGSTFLPQLGIAIDGAAQAFERWVNNGLKDGSIKRQIDAALQGFRDLFAILGNIGSIVGSVFAGLSTAVDSPLANIRKLTDALADFFKSADAQSALHSLGDALASVAKLTRDVLLKALQDIAPIIRDLAPGVQAIADKLDPKLTKALDSVKQPLDDLAKLFSSGAQSDGLQKFIDTLSGASSLNLVTDNFGNLYSALRGLLTLDFSGFPKLGAGLFGNPLQQAELKNIGKFLTDFFNGTKTQVQTELANIGKFFSDFFTGIVTTNAQTEIARVGDFFRGIGQSISDAIGAVGDIAGQLKDKAAEGVQAFLDGARDKFNDVVAFFSQSPFQIGFAIGTQIGQLLKSGQDLVEQLRVGAVTKFEEVKTFFTTTVPQAITAALSTLGSTMAQVATDAWTAFLNTCTTEIANVVAFFANVPAQIHDAVAPLPGQVVGVATEAGSGFLATVTDWLSRAVDFVSTIPGLALVAIGALPGLLGSLAVQAGQGFLDGLVAKFNAAIDFVRGVPGAIVSAIGDLSGTLVGAGRALMDGLGAGIRAGYQALLDFVRGIAAGIAAVKGPLSYDKVVLKPAGLALMSGLLDGLREGNSGVQRFASTIANSLMSNTSGGLISSAASLTAGGALGQPSAVGSSDQPITVNVLLSQEQIAGIAQVEITRRDRATKRTVLAGSGQTF